MNALTAFKKEIKVLEKNMKLAVNAVNAMNFDEALKSELITSIEETIQLEIKNRVQVIIRESLKEAELEQDE